MAGLLENHAWARPSHTEEQGASVRRLRPRFLFDSYWGRQPCYDSSGVPLKIEEDREAAMEKAALAGNLTVTIKQISKTPITIKVEVKNKSTRPITFLNDSTPLDPEAFGLGLFHITPHKLPNVNFGNRVLPSRPHSYSYRSLIELSPGMAISDTVMIKAGNSTLKKEWAKMLVVADKLQARMKGDWKGLWGRERDGARELVAEHGLHYHSHPAPFESNMIELEFE